MEQLPERVSGRLAGAGVEQDGARTDEAESSELHRSGSKWSRVIEPEGDKEKDRLQARLREHTDEAPANSSQQRHNIVRSHYNVEDSNSFELKKTDETHLKELQENKQHYELQADTVPLLMGPSTSDSEPDSGETGTTAIAPDSISHVIPDQIGHMFLDRTRNAWFKSDSLHQLQDAEDDPFAGIPDFTVDKEWEMHSRRPDQKIQNLWLDELEYDWEDEGIKTSPQHMRPYKHGSIEDVKETEQLPPPEPMDKQQKQRIKTSAPRPIKIDAGEVLVSNHASTELFDNGTEHLLNNQKEAAKNQGEECHAEHTAEGTRNDSRSEDAEQSSTRSSQMQDHRVPWEKDIFAKWIAKWVTDTFWPPSKGYQRIWYLCGCGQHTYLDVRELEPGGVEMERRSISESSAAARRAHSPQSSAASGVQALPTPPPVHLNPISSRDTASPSSPSQETPYAPRPDLNPVSTTSPGPSAIIRRDTMFLLICINGMAYKTLGELRCLDIDDSCNDELLIRGILNQYEQARKGCRWTVDLLLPTWMLPATLIKHLKNIWGRLPISVRMPSIIRESLLAQSISEWWNCWAPDISLWAPLHIIDTADFVEFELIPHPEGKEAFPSHFTPGRWPAPDNKQYRYRPVPMRCIKTMNLWHMRRPGPHTEVYWYNTVPKKVDGALYRPSGTVEDVIGYGVRINERLNDVLVLWWSLIFILATGVFVYVYSRCTSDNSSAFGLGAYLLAAFTVYIQLQYAWWKRA